MRKRALLLIACLFPSALAAADEARLRAQLDNGRFFELRRALEPSDPDPNLRLYRGVIACRFGQEGEGIEILRGVLASAPDSRTTATAQKELAEAYERIGRYKEAAAAWREWLKLAPADDPDREENANTLTLLNVVSDVPPLTVEWGRDPAPKSFKSVRSRIGVRNVPVGINGITGQWIFDTGANVTTISESEAKRMGLTPRETTAWVSGSTGQRNALRVAVAKDLNFGAATFHNVILLVLSDQSLFIAPIHFQITGILGLPVLRALGTVGMAAGGEVRIQQPGAKNAGAEPNMFFEGDIPIIDVNPGAGHLQMFLDTGANSSAFYPSFRAAMPADELANLKRKTEKQGGIGGSVSHGVELIPRLRIEIGDKSVTLKKESLRLDPPSWNNRFRDGVIGMDALWGGYLLDFADMRIEPD